MRIVIGLLLVLSMSSCAHRSSIFSRSANDPMADAEALPSVESHRLSDPKPPKVEDPELAIANVPVEVNADVERWLAYYQGRGKPHMEVHLARSTRYSDVMKRILRENGLPEELIYVAMIESGFSSRATSHASAVGYWQFIRGTAVRYGLRVDGHVDERRDPVLATQAAAQYLKSLHTLFDSWYLAMAAYNVGENRVMRELMNHHTRDFWELVRLKRLPKETRNYVPKYIAARMIAENPEKYGFTNINYAAPIEFDQITVAHHVDLAAFAQNLGISFDEMKALNPKFRTNYAPTEGESLELRVPPGQREAAIVAVAKSIATHRQVAEVSGTTRYLVRRGDTLSGIARRHGVSIAQLRAMNNMSTRSILRAGSRINIPDRSGVAHIGSRNRQLTSDGRYLVKRGDTLSAIAGSFNTSIQELQRLNNMSARSVLAAGRYIQVRQSGESTQQASNDTPTAGTSTHTVRNGENLTLIARKYGISVQELQQINNIGRGSILHVGQTIKVSGQSGEASAPTVHIVRRGENLSLIANKYGTTVSELQRLNNLSRRSLIRVGQRLVVSETERTPASSMRRRVHIVRNGETLSNIATRYSVPVSKIARVNDIANSSVIHAGSKLIIPE